MSNYLSMVVKRPMILSVQSWLEAYCVDPSEIFTKQLTESSFLIFVSKGALEDVRPQDSFYFKGHAVDHDQQSIIFGASGRKLQRDQMSQTGSELKSVEGCYLYSTWTEKEIVFENDAYANCAMLYFAEPDVFAVSDSFFVLSKLRKHLGYVNTPNEVVLLARSWGNTMAGQLLSNETQIQQIKYAPTGTTIAIVNNRLLNVKVKTTDLSGSDWHRPLSSYEDELRASVRRVASLTQTLSKISVNSVRVAISGGFDSRVVLAAALASPAARELAVFNCTNNAAHQKIDYEVVSSLSEKFSFPLGLRKQATKRSVKSPVENPANLWLLSSAGIYDFLYMPTSFSKSESVFNLGGFGAEVYKGMFGWKKIAKIAATIKDPLVSEAFKVQAEKGIQQFGISPNDPIGSEWHYLGYRNVVHSSRSSMTSMLGMRPLMQRQLVALSRSESNPFPRPKSGALSMISDMLIYANPDLAKCPFDVPEKDLDHSYVDARSKRLGRLSEYEIFDYKILGNAEEIHHGASEFFYKLANTFNTEQMSPAMLGKYIGTGFELLPSYCKPSYEAGYVETKLLLESPTASVAALRSYAGKLVGLSALLA